jgi:hypothetical protein
MSLQIAQKIPISEVYVSMVFARSKKVPLYPVMFRVHRQTIPSALASKTVLHVSAMIVFARDIAWQIRILLQCVVWRIVASANPMVRHVMTTSHVQRNLSASTINVSDWRRVTIYARQPTTHAA